MGNINSQEAVYREKRNALKKLYNMDKSQLDQLTQRMDDLHNEIGETKGMVKNLRKVLIKLEVIDDRFIF